MSQYISPFLQLFEEPMTDDSITDFEYVEYVTRDSDVNKDGQRIIETQDLDQYLLPHKAVLEIRGRLQKNDNTNYNAGDKITLVNNGWCLFQSAQYQVNNNTVEDINLYLPQASTMMNLVMFSDDYSRSTSTSMMWHKDTGTGTADLDEFAATSEDDKHGCDRNMLDELRVMQPSGVRETIDRAFVRGVIGAKHKLGLGKKKFEALAEELHKPI